MALRVTLIVSQWFAKSKHQLLPDAVITPAIPDCIARELLAVIGMEVPSFFRANQFRCRTTATAWLLPGVMSNLSLPLCVKQDVLALAGLVGQYCRPKCLTPACIGLNVRPCRQSTGFDVSQRLLPEVSIYLRIALCKRFLPSTDLLSDFSNRTVRPPWGVGSMLGILYFNDKEFERPFAFAARNADICL